MIRKKRQKEGYDVSNANAIFNEFQEQMNIDLTDKTREIKYVRLRALFYKILEEYNNMNDRMIKNLFSSRGVFVGTSSIFHSKRKVVSYYNECSVFRRSYETYFDALEKPKTKSIPVDKLELIIADLKGSKRQEIYDMVNLRVKSWSWKSNDKCKVYQGEGDLIGY